jgi:malonyl-CoA O-methyltransferase
MAPLLDRRAVIAGFNKAAPRYDQMAVVQREVADRLLDRLDWVKIAPQTILDMGARTGYTTQFLAQRYPDAQLIAIDWAQNLLQTAKKTAPRSIPICADPQQLPLPSQCADLIIANLTWHWLDDHSRCLQEWRRLLKPGGLLLFTTCGPDTLSELRASFAAIDDQPHVHLFLDMHDIGDALMAAQFADPVMQAEHLYFTYSSPARLLDDLRGSGVTNALQSRRRGLTGKNRWQRMLDEYSKFFRPEMGYVATIEVIYGLCWATAQTTHYADAHSEITIPLSQIRRKNHGQNL